MVCLISWIMGESPMTCSGGAFSGAMRQTVGLLSSDNSFVAFFMDLNAFTVSMFETSSVYFRVQSSDPVLLTSGVAHIAYLQYCLVSCEKHCDAQGA